MGANVSTQIAKATSVLENVQENTCENASQIFQNISGLNITLRGSSCPLEITNEAKVEQICDLSATSSALAEAAQQLTADQKSTLSLSANVSTGIQENTSIIKNILKNKCGSASLIKQNIENVNLIVEPYVSPDGKTVIPADCGILRFANKANAQQQCVLKAVNDSVSKLKQDQAAKQVTEFPPIFSLLGMLIFGPIIAIVVIVVIVTIVKMLKKPKNDDASALLAGSSDGKQRCSQDPKTGKNYADPNGPYSCSEAELKGGGRRRRSSQGFDIRFENLPIVVIGLFMLVWYARMTDPNQPRPPLNEEEKYL